MSEEVNGHNGEFVVVNGGANGVKHDEDDAVCINFSLSLGPRRRPSKKILRRVFSSCEDEPDPIGPVGPDPRPPPEHHHVVTPAERNITPQQWLKRIHDWNVSIEMEDILSDDKLLKIDRAFMKSLIESDYFGGVLDFLGTVVTMEALALLVADEMVGKVTDLNLGQCHFIIECDDVFITRDNPAHLNDFRKLLSNVLVQQRESLESLNMASILVIPCFPEDGLPKLKSLSLAKTQCTRSDLEYVAARCKSLELLSLQFASRNLREFGPIAQLKHLTKLWLSGCKISDKNVSNIIRQFENQLVDLRINEVTSFSVFELLDSLSNLKILYVGHQNRPRLSLKKLSSYGKLEVLSLRNCAINSYDFDQLAKHCGRSLRKLEVNDRLLDMQILGGLLDSCTMLEALAVENAARAETAIAIGINAPPTLRYLSFRNCPQIETPDLESLCEERIRRMAEGEELAFLTCLHSAYKNPVFPQKILHKFIEAKFEVIHEDVMAMNL